MGNTLIPGAFSNDQTDYSAFANSMAHVIENELNALMTLDGLPALETDPDDPSVRDRRRLFVAIARGVVRYIRDNKDSIDILRSDGTTVQPTLIRTSGL